MKQTKAMDIKGKAVIPYLAQAYQQLYVVPGEPGCGQSYKDIVLKGQDAPSKSLSHFIMNDEDSLETADTPAKAVQVVTLSERRDFETFLHIMANKCVPYDIPKTQGASILDGVINWQKISSHREKWLKEQADAGVFFPDWSEEFRRFTADGANYKDALIVLARGPYSNITAADAGMDEEEWLGKSLVIRRFHECTHFICRRKYPEKINAVWDEVVADAAGIIAAFGRFDAQLAELFLGIDGNGYIGGRLENYVEDKGSLDRVAADAHILIAAIAELYGQNKGMAPFDFAIVLEEKQQELWLPS